MMICTTDKPRRSYPSFPRLTSHAIQRWRERVGNLVEGAGPAAELAEFVASGHERPTPRHWTTVAPAPGLTFLYWAGRPDVCALIVDHTVVTILTRRLCARRHREDRGDVVLPMRRRAFAPTIARAA